MSEEKKSLIEAVQRMKKVLEAAKALGEKGKAEREAKGETEKA